MNFKISINLAATVPTLQAPKNLTTGEIQAIPTQLANLSLEIQNHVEEVTKNHSL